MLRAVASLALFAVACGSTTEPLGAPPQAADERIEVAIPAPPAQSSSAPQLEPASPPVVENELASLDIAGLPELAAAEPAAGGHVMGSGGGSPPSPPPPHPRGPNGRVEVGQPAVTGVANALAVVRGMRPGFRRCYNRALANDPTIQGDLLVTATIDASGAVTAVKLSKTRLSDVLKACVHARLASAQFAPPDKAPAAVTFPITFTLP